ncbi:uncharacterized protein [Mytilus edulis]|uniref:uncharacterized protein n=1 Tax=Mytilus edulis TaxID=6550 RepID=UPI0039EE680E
MCAVHIFHFIREIIKIGRQLCEVLISLSSHPENQNVPERRKKTKSIAGGRPLDIVGVQKIREQWGIIVPINTSICINCRRKLSGNIEEPKKITTDKDNFQSSYMVTDQSSQNTISSSQNTASTIEDYMGEHYVDLLINYLNSRKVSTISLPIQSWKDRSMRTKRRYQGLFKECFYTITDIFSPGEYDDIFNNICEDDEHQDEDDNGNSKMIPAIVESYKKNHLLGK